MAGKRRRKAKVKKLGWRVRVLMVIFMVAAMLAMPTSVVMLIGMLPTFAAFMVDRTNGKTLVITVGAMNIAGCVPFALRLWTTEHTMDNAVSIITDPRTIIVMYSAAGIGYIIDWAISGMMITMMVSRAKSRREQIEKQKTLIVERWGMEATGDIKIDAFGFPLEAEDQKSEHFRE